MISEGEKQLEEGHAWAEEAGEEEEQLNGLIHKYKNKFNWTDLIKGFILTFPYFSVDFKMK